MKYEKDELFDTPESSSFYTTDLAETERHVYYNSQGDRNAVVRAPGLIGVVQGGASLPSGNDVSKLEEISGWNWGAFILDWIWLFGFKMEYALALIGISFLTTALNFISGGLSAFPAALFFFAVKIYLGVKGNQLAWAHRHFQDIAEFRRVTGAWTKWGIIVALACFLLTLLIIGGTIAVAVFLGKSLSL